MTLQRVRRLNRSGIGMRGIGDTPGCGPGSVQEALTNQINSGAFADPAAYGGGPLPAALAAEAAVLCQEAGGTSAFGCPPMAGCDPASIMAAANALAPQVAQTGSAYSPGFAPAPATYWATQGPLPPTPAPAVTPQGIPAGAVAAQGIQFTNTTRGGSAFQVGDNWRLVITGPANQSVSSSAIQNGASLGTTNFGSTDSSGNFVLTGTMASSSIGSWTEQWFVGGQLAGQISFTVQAAPGAPPPTQPNNALSNNAPQSGSSVTSEGIAAGQNQSGSGTPLGPNCAAPVGISEWAQCNPILAAAIAIGGILLLTQMSKK